MSGPAVLRVAPAALARLLDHAGRSYPAEAVGLLVADRAAPGGDPSPLGLPELPRISEVAPLVNAARHPRTGSVVERSHLIDRIEALAERGLKPVGAYHSHPDREARPSEADVRAIRSSTVEVIVAVSPLGAGRPRAWWFEPGRPPVELSLWPDRSSP
jgi:proteasome lid subunit RPN8/RPN11